MVLLLLLAAQTFVAQAQEKLVALSFDDGPNTTTRDTTSRITASPIVRCRSSRPIPSPWMSE